MRRSHGRMGNLGFILVLTAGFGPPGDAQDFRRGDANGDGTLDLSDGSRSLGHLFLGQEAPPCLDAADADDSGEVELTDAVFTFSHLFLGGPAPPSPGPSLCGPDPSDDPLACASYPPCASSTGTSFLLDPEGGEFTTASGITLIVPAGAVEKETEVTIGPLPTKLDAALNEGPVFSTHERRLLAGFSGTPDGLVFAKPIRVRLPVSPLRQGGIPAPASFDLETLATTIEESTISWFGDEGMAEFDVSHFSGGGVLEMFDEEGGLQIIEGSEVSSDDPCREQQFTVVNSAEDRAVSTAAADCQTVSDFLLVVLDACGGQQERHLVSSWNCEIQLEVDQEDTSIPVGHETKLSARVFFTEFPEVEVRLPLTWVNTIPSTADFVPQSDGFIASSGILTGKSPGGAAVGVRTPDPELSLLLGVLITSLTVETPTPEVDVAEGKTRMLEAQARGVDGNIVDCPLLFDSVDPSIATVTETGEVRGEKRGETEVRVHPTDPKGCPGGCGTIQVTVIRNVEGRWTSPLDVTLELPSDEGSNLMGTCDLTSELAITQNGREACGQFRTTGKCTLMPPDADPIVIEINETGFLAGLIAEDDTFSYCSQRDDEQEVCLHSSGTFLSDDSVEGTLSCREVDSEAGLLSETHGTFTGQRTSPEVPAGTSCLPISGAAALAACQ